MMIKTNVVKEDIQKEIKLEKQAAVQLFTTKETKDVKPGPVQDRR